MTPTARSLQYLRANGWTACVVERWIPQAKRRVDAFGFGDILAFHTCGPTLIQVTTGDHFADRLTKITASTEAQAWQRCGGNILLLAWSKQGGRGKRKVWTVKEAWI